MKKLARLTLFFSLSFIIFFSAALFFNFLSSWIDLVRFVPVGPVPGVGVDELFWKSLPAAIYLSALFSVSYTARREISVPAAILGVFVLGCLFTGGFSLGIKRVEALKPALNPVPSLESAPGLILRRSENSMVLLRESSEPRGPRVVSLPGRPLVYQEVPLGPNNTILSLPAIPFGVELPWFIRSLIIDLTLGAGELQRRLEKNFISFAAYAFSLVLLLSSLRFLLELSRWPLANIFIAAVVFRLILALETFLNAREINELLGSFLNRRIQPEFVTPLVFCVLGGLFILYTFLAGMAQGSGRRGKTRISASAQNTGGDDD